MTIINNAHKGTNAEQKAISVSATTIDMAELCSGTTAEGITIVPGDDTILFNLPEKALVTDIRAIISGSTAPASSTVEVNVIDSNNQSTLLLDVPIDADGALQYTLNFSTGTGIAIALQVDEVVGGELILTIGYIEYTRGTGFVTQY